MANESKYDVFSNLGSIAPKSLFTTALVPQYDENGTIVGYGQQQTFAVPNAMPVGVDENNPTPQGYQVAVGNIDNEPILANYDYKGNLTGYESRQFGVDGKNYAGNWDASGVAAPTEIKPHGGNFLSNFLSSDAGKLAAIAGAAYAGGAFDPSMLGAGASGAGAADAATLAEGWGGSGAVGSGSSSGLLSGTAAASPLATQGSAGYGQLGSGTFGATGIPEGSQFVTQGGLAAPATVGQGGALGAGSFAANGSTLAQAGLLGGAATLAGELAPATDYYAAGTAGAGTALGAGTAGTGTLLGAGMADAAAGGLGGLTAEQLGQLGLVQGGLGLLGGVLGGNTAAGARSQAAQQYAKSAQQGANMASFRPVGTTTTFGTSNFQIDPLTGQLTSAGYQLSPQLQAYQDQIMGSNRQSLNDATTLQNLGRQYIAQDPNQVASNWYNQQQALLAPSRDTESARLANQLQQTGRTGVSVAQGGNLQAANPETAALANARAMADAQMAANAQTYGQQQVGFGQGLLSNAYQPFNAGLTTASNVEALGQQPFTLSSNLANLSSTAGARAGQILATGMGNSISSQQAANSYNPWATAVQGVASNPLTGLGLLSAFA